MRTLPGAGQPLAQLSEGFHVTVLDAASDYALVTSGDQCSQIRVTGYVQRDQLEMSSLGGGGCSYGVIGIGSSREEVSYNAKLAPGRVLLAPGTRMVVGCVVQERGAVVDDRGLYRARTAWGMLEFELAPASIRCSEPEESDPPRRDEPEH